MVVRVIKMVVVVMMVVQVIMNDGDGGEREKKKDDIYLGSIFFHCHGDTVHVERLHWVGERRFIDLFFLFYNL